MNKNKKFQIEELDFESISLNDIAKLSSENFLSDSNKAEPKKKVMNLEDQELLQILFADELIQTQQL